MRKSSLEQSYWSTLYKHFNDFALSGSFAKVGIYIFLSKILCFVSCWELSLPFVLVSSSVKLVDYRMRFYNVSLKFAWLFHSRTHWDVSFSFRSRCLYFVSIPHSSFSLCIQIVLIKSSIIFKRMIRFHLSIDPFRNWFVHSNWQWRHIQRIFFWVQRSLRSVVHMREFEHLLCHFSIILLQATFAFIKFWVVHQTAFFISDFIL